MGGGSEILVGIPLTLEEYQAYQEKLTAYAMREGWGEDGEYEFYKRKLARTECDALQGTYMYGLYAGKDILVYHDLMDVIDKVQYHGVLYLNLQIELSRIRVFSVTFE